MKLRESLRKWLDRDQEAGFDPKQFRIETTEALADSLAAHYPDLVVSKIVEDHTGPLGGQSSRFTITVETIVGHRTCIVNVYANGLFSPERMDEWGLTS